MDRFQALFGIDPAAVRETCVLIPFVTRSILRDFGIGRMNRGRLYSSGVGPDWTLIQTRIGPVFAGDAVLHLKSTPCREIIFLGTGGLFREDGPRRIGSLICPSVWYARESFTELAIGKDSPVIEVFPDPRLRRSLIRAAGLEEDGDSAGVSFGSLELQAGERDIWRGRGAEVVDLESAAVLAAAGRINRRAAALLAVSDIVGARPFDRQLSRDEKTRLQQSLNRAARSICACIKEKLNG
ncbi:MAG: hypothetical protein V1789_07005 [PVC group bacterium]